MRYRNRYVRMLVCLGLASCGACNSHGAETNLGGDTGSNGSAGRGQGDAGVPGKPDPADGGNDSDGGGLPNPSPRAVYLSPADVSTAVNTSKLELWVDGVQGDLGVANLEALAAEVSVVTWPERQTIATDVTAVDASQANDMRAHVTVAPAGTLDSRWYAIVVEALPIGFQWWNDPGSRNQKVARFRSDNRPAIAWVQRCDKGGVRHLSVHFSEPVSSAAARGTSVVGASCEPLAGGAGPVVSAYLDCSTDGEVDDITVTLSDDATVLVDKDAWRDIGDNCFEFVPEQLAP